MANYRKLLDKPLFSPLLFLTDKKTGRKEEKKLSKTTNRLTQEATPLMFDTTSPEMTPYFARKVQIQQILRVYSSVRSTNKKYSAHLTKSNGRKRTQRAKQAAHRGPLSSFAFPAREAHTENKMSRTKQSVLRTIRKMMEENRVIRVRLQTLRRMSRSK